MPDWTGSKGRAPTPRKAAALLARERKREFAVADAGGEPFGVFRGRILAISGDKLGKRREKRGLRETIAIDAVEARFSPGFLQIAKSRTLLLVVGQRLMWLSRSLNRRHDDLCPPAVSTGHEFLNNKADVSTRARPTKPADRGKVNSGGPSFRIAP